MGGEKAAVQGYNLNTLSVSRWEVTPAKENLWSQMLNATAPCAMIPVK